VLQRVLPLWCTPSHTAWAVFPGRELMPTKTRAFVDMLRIALGADSAEVPPPESRRGARRPAESGHVHRQKDYRASGGMRVERLLQHARARGAPS
jgi:hypothetical protein